ncbi:hypothetical protein PPNK14_38210 [Pectobacterium parmentieri]
MYGGTKWKCVCGSGNDAVIDRECGTNCGTLSNTRDNRSICADVSAYASG